LQRGPWHTVRAGDVDAQDLARYDPKISRFHFQFEEGDTMKPVNGTQLALCFCGGLAKLPPLSDRELYGTTVDVARILRVTPQRVNQLVALEGLPKIGRDRFYMPDVFNFQNVQLIAERFGKRPLEMNFYSYVDFTLGRDSPIVIPLKTFEKIFSEEKKE
jgi:hypothetical protein